MKIAVIGGGASGMVTAYLLDRQGHHVTVFERQPVLGGHIRTLNQNIRHQTPCQEFLEAGVLEFSAKFTQFLDLMHELGVELEPVRAGSGMFFQDGRHFLSPVTIAQNFTGWQKWRETLHIDALYARSAGLWLKTQFAKVSELHNQPLSAYLRPTRPQTNWLKLLTMYSYSMAYGLIDDFPAELAIPALRQYVFTDWFRIKGGVYSYIERILDQFHGKIILNASIKAIFRRSNAVEMVLNDGTIQWFDKLVLATPPDQVLKLLADPRHPEIKRFAHWQANYVETIIHADTSMYQPYGIRQGSEFDFFQTNSTPTDWGYNAALNQLCGVKDDRQYSLAFNLKNQLNPHQIIHTQAHHTPLYTVAALEYRDEIIATNGENHTYHAGAYLSDGLHEGAIVAAFKVAAAIAQVARPNMSTATLVTS
jgi:uncharacterized protein